VPNRGLLLAGVAALLLGLLGGYGFRHQQQIASAADGLSLGQPGFELLDLTGELRRPDDWAGQVVVLNFWASWCPPCIKEMPEFVALQTEYGEQGLQFVGIAVESEAAARAFLQKVPVNYPILLGELEGIPIAQAYGNTIGALPYTVVIDRDGSISARRPGALTREQLVALVSPLL